MAYRWREHNEFRVVGIEKIKSVITNSIKAVKRCDAGMIMIL